MSDHDTITAIASAVFRGLREMDASSSSGLCNYVACSPYAGQQRKDEAAITWGVTEALGSRWRIEQREHRYPAGGGKCDRVLELPDNARVWIEVKLAWRTWYFEVRKDNASFYYEGYFTGRHHSHSVAGDFAKLERITSQHGRYVVLILVGFDADDAQMNLDMAHLVESEGLEQRGWHLLSDSWVTSQSAECWHRCWCAWRATE